MEKVKTLVTNKKAVLAMVYFATLVGVATVTPMIGHIQPITGPLVNATLFLGAILLGPSTAVLVGLVPSLIALSVGTLPAILAPMVPFIMVSNAILIITFAYLRKSSFWGAVIMASLLKFAFLLATSSVVINLLLKKEVAAKVATMMSWPQLVTALAGGFIAYTILKGVKRLKKQQ